MSFQRVTKYNDYPFCYQYQLKQGFGYETILYVIKSPHANCQTFSIADIHDSYHHHKNVLKEAVLDMHSFFNKLQVFIDCPGNLVKDIIELFKDTHTVIVNTPYKNSTGNPMCFLLLRRV